MNHIDFAAGLLGAVASSAAAILWWLASRAAPLDTNHIEESLRRAGRMNSRAAVCSCVAALCAAWVFASGAGLI